MKTCTKIEKLQEQYVLMGRLMDELKIRNCSRETKRTYMGIIGEFLKSGLAAGDFIAKKSGKDNSKMRMMYFALKFFYENVLRIAEFRFGVSSEKSFRVLPVVMNNKGVLDAVYPASQQKNHLFLSSIISPINSVGCRDNYCGS